MYVTGCKLSNGGYRMHSPEPPYQSTVYLGYTLEGMKRKYRRNHNLKYKHIIWVIVGKED